MAAILDFEMFLSELYKELKGLNLEFLLITLKSINKTYFGTILSIFIFFNRLYLSCLKSYWAEIWNISSLNTTKFKENSPGNTFGVKKLEFKILSL